MQAKATRSIAETTIEHSPSIAPHVPDDLGVTVIALMGPPL
jgi:hypothetical protein